MWLQCDVGLNFLTQALISFFSFKGKKHGQKLKANSRAIDHALNKYWLDLGTRAKRTMLMSQYFDLHRNTAI